jgi:hypothetical protein
MKKTIRFALLTLAIFSITGIASLMACEIEFSVVGKKKEKYSVGDEIVVNVKITLIHRACPIAMKDTKFDTKGLEMLGATDWKETSTNVWERKVKMKVVSNKSGKLVLTATRTCDKEGGFGSVSFSAVPLQ